MTNTYVPGNSKQIIVGAAAVFIADDNTKPLPVWATVDPTSAKSAEELLAEDADWQETGYTDGGVTVSYEPTYGDVTVDQLLDSALVFKTGMKVMVNTTFTEATLENLLVTWGAKNSDLNGDTLDINAGSLGDYPHERGVAFVGPGPRYNVSQGQAKERIYYVQRAIQTQTTAHSLKRDAATTLPVSFRCLPGGASGTSNSYGSVIDRAHATS